MTYDFFNDFLNKEFLTTGNLIISFIVFVHTVYIRSFIYNKILYIFIIYTRWRTLQDDKDEPLASINSYVSSPYPFLNKVWRTKPQTELGKAREACRVVPLVIYFTFVQHIFFVSVVVNVLKDVIRISKEQLPSYQLRVEEAEQSERESSY